MKVQVFGLGKSINAYNGTAGLKIGVNDVFKYLSVDHLIVLDPPSIFSKERQEIIKSSTPQQFISYNSLWNFMPNYKEIKLAFCRSNLSQIDEPDVYPYSIMSPYVAIVHAYKIGAKEITIYGVDLNDHHQLSIDRKLQRVLTDIDNLNKFLIRKGVSLKVFNKSSQLSKVLNYLSNE